MPTWTTPGTYTWVVPSGVTELLALDLAGGQGGADWSGNAHGGKGGRLQVATLAVTPGATFDIVVGGQGANGVTTDDGSGADGTGAAGGNGVSTIAASVGEFGTAGEGRSGGGGGAGTSPGTAGGAGGAGNGTVPTANRGGGGGANRAGATGVVIVRYPYEP